VVHVGFHETGQDDVLRETRVDVAGRLSDPSLDFVQ